MALEATVGPLKYGFEEEADQSHREMNAFHSAFHLFARQAAALPLDLSAANWQAHNFTLNNQMLYNNKDISRTSLSPNPAKGEFFTIGNV